MEEEEEEVEEEDEEEEEEKEEEEVEEEEEEEEWKRLEKSHFWKNFGKHFPKMPFLENFLFVSWRFLPPKTMPLISFWFEALKTAETMQNIL